MARGLRRNRFLCYRSTEGADGLDRVVLTGHGSRERHGRMARNREFNVCEFNVGAYLMARYGYAISRD
jgi:hypothetical protein